MEETVFFSYTDVEKDYLCAPNYISPNYPVFCHHKAHRICQHKWVKLQIIWGTWAI